jgi:hypothetical protein
MFPPWGFRSWGSAIVASFTSYPALYEVRAAG